MLVFPYLKVQSPASDQTFLIDTGPDINQSNTFGINEYHSVTPIKTAVFRAKKAQAKKNLASTIGLGLFLNTKISVIPTTRI